MEVRAKNLSMTFSDAGREIQIFNNLNFHVASGSSMAIVGSSEVGKTTLLYLLGAMETPTGGDVLIGQQSLAALRASGDDIALFRGRNVGFVFQFHQLLAEFDAVENVAMPLLIQGKPMGEARKRASELLNRVGLGHRLTHRPGALSGGEQQRVAIARAVAAKPGVILADEPTGNLDPKTSGEVRALLRELQAEQGITLITVTHSREFADSMERVIELTPDGIVEVK